MATADGYYPVISLPHSDQIPDERERLGSKEKFWFRHSDGSLWLFKFPRPNTGEHWAEKVAAEIAGLIGVRCAEVELARYGDDLGVQSRSFTEPEWLKAHGNEIMAACIGGYDENLRFGQRDHSIKNIAVALTVWVEKRNLDWNETAGELVSYAILDGLIGNTDRHHENWMFFYDPTQRSYRLAPSYDHGSSLGRELQDISRRESRSRRHILDSGGVLNYLMNRRSGGSVYVSARRTQAPPPLSVAQLLCRWQPSLARQWLERLQAVSNVEFRTIIDKVPPAFITDTAKEFAYQVMTVSRNELLRRAL